MAAQKIKYIIEGDASGEIKAANKAKEAVKNATESLSRLQNEAKNVSGLKNYSKALITVRDSLSKNNPQLKTFNKLIADTKTEMKGMKTANAFNTSTINGLKQYKRALTQQRDAVADTDKAFASYNKRIQATNQRLKRLAKTGISQVGKSFQGLRLRMDKVNTSFARAPFKATTPRISRFTDALGRSRTTMSRYASAAGSANFAVLSLSQGVQDASFGFIGIQNNITQLVQSFTQLRSQTGSTRAAFASFGNTILGPSGILLGISALTTLITVAVQKYGSLGNAFDALFGNLTSVEKAQKAVNDAMKESVDTTATAIKNITRVQVAFSNAEEGTISQNRALDIFNDKMGDAVGEMDSFKEAQDFINDSSDEFIKFTFAKATAMQSLAQASKLSAKAMLMQQQGVKVSFWDNITSQFKTLFSGAIFSGNAPVKALMNIRKDWKDTITDMKDTASKIQEDAQKQWQDIWKKFPQFMKEIGSDSGNDLKDSFSSVDVFADFKKKLKQLRAYLAEGLITEETFDKKRLEAVVDTMKKFLDVGKKATDQYRQLSFIYSELTKLPPLQSLQGGKAGFIFGNVRKNAEDIKGIFKELNAARSETMFKQNFLGLSGIDAAKQKISALKDAILSLREQGVQPNTMGMMVGENGKLIPDTAAQKMQMLIDKYNILIQKNASFKETTKTTFEGLSTSVKALGKGLQTMFEGMFEGFVKGESFVKMLENAIQKLIIKLTAAAAAAGILAAVTGGGFLGILGGLVGIPKLATGGFVSSPTIAMVGDAPGGEWVLNQQQMGALLNNRQPQVVRVEGEFIQRGRDLVAVVDSQNEVNDVL